MSSTHLIVDATPAANTINEHHIGSRTYISAPGVPLWLDIEAQSKISNRLLHDPLQIGVATIVACACNKTFMVNNSRSSRAARWIRNKWITDVCRVCGLPDWKLAKYSSTQFKRHHGSLLLKKGENHRVKK